MMRHGCERRKHHRPLSNEVMSDRLAVKNKLYIPQLVQYLYTFLAPSKHISASIVTTLTLWKTHSELQQREHDGQIFVDLSVM
jgi:hypothetical protein